MLLHYKITYNNTQHVLRNCLLMFCREKSSLNLWEQNINTDIKKSIENHWSTIVVNVPSNHSQLNQRQYYILPMFPYPSGNLHMGHVRVYALSDTIARFQKLNGYDVIQPFGWDAFGLPAENAAIERKVPANKWTETNIASMKTQLKNMGFDFDWKREFSTCDPDYYKWTQYIFLKLFEGGLAYRSKAKVNWDPVDKTVLADEQVDELGCSWRSGAKVENKYLTQWYIKTTKYAKLLYDGLDDESLQSWKDIINLQKHWIGECNGVVVQLEINLNGKAKSVEVWTSEPYKFIHGDFLTISTRHALLQDLPKANNYVFTCYNPVSKSTMPVYVSDNVNYPDGKDIYIASATFDESDKELGFTLNFDPARNKDNINIDKENQVALQKVLSKEIGGYFVSSKLKDWLISRQRFWGTPIPVIHCDKCGTVPVPYNELPVKLPECDEMSGIQTLSRLKDWVICKCPKCNCNAQRETDTMDTFVDSSWYFYRFLDPINKKEPFAKDNVIPVDLYIGGKEHAVLHLYYARFMSYFLNSLGWTSSREPFKKLLVQGMVMGKSYKVKSSGKYIPAENVEQKGKRYAEKNTGESVSVQWEKMSKSKYNGENPERLLETYGCDTTRLLMLADVSPATPRRWSDATLPGVLNWQRRLWLTIKDVLKYRNEVTQKSLQEQEYEEIESKLWDTRNYIISAATYHFKYTHSISVAISGLQTLTSTLRNKIAPEVIANSKEYELSLASLIIMLSPVTPHFASELWAGLQAAPRAPHHAPALDWHRGVLHQTWPKVDDHYPLSFLCKVDGADVCDLKVQARDLISLTEQNALDTVLSKDIVTRKVKRGIVDTKFELYPGCRAILNIFTDRKENKHTETKEQAVS